MKIINEKDINQVTVKGKRGEVYLKDIVASATMVAGIRIIAPDSDVPARPHKHEDLQIVYVIKGTTTLDNASYLPGQTLHSRASNPKGH